MRRKTTTFCSMLVAAVLLLTGSCAWSQQYTIANSNASIFMMESGGSAAKFTVNWGKDPFAPDNPFIPTNLTGIGTNGSLVYVADKNATTSMLHVLRITEGGLTPKATRIQTIELKQGSNILSKPSSISLDASGGIYVLGESNYAYVAPSSYNVTISAVGGNSNYTPLSDIATFAGGSASNAIIAHQYNNSTYVGETYATSIRGTSPTAALSDFESNLANRYPQAVAVHPNVTTTPIAYILSKWGNNTPETRKFGTVTVVNAATPALGSTNNRLELQEGFIPLDIATFTSSVGKKYIGIVAVSENELPMNNEVVWRYELDTNGMPIESTLMSYYLPASSSSKYHQVTLSLDGSTFWITSEYTKTVDVLDSNTWLSLDHFALSESAHYITGWNGASAPVPEPSSMIAMLSFATGLLGFARRRNR